MGKTEDWTNCNSKPLLDCLGNEIEDAFKYYGPLRNVWVARNPPGFAFVEFEDSRDAEDAIRGLDGRRVCGRKARVEKYGRTICGRRARVEMSNGKGGSGRFRGPPPRSRGGIMLEIVLDINAVDVTGPALAPGAVLEIAELVQEAIRDLVAAQDAVQGHAHRPPSGAIVALVA
ncbi:hypothetical protein JTB14_029438 [Gonioctena quinquepunctata]|nr:hypothetical protein JTB14_029438 [Gonioctena quinquepunctata]